MLRMAHKRSQSWSLMLGLVVLAALAVTHAQQPAAKPATGQAWIKKSNEYAQVALKLAAKYAPEGAGRLGIEGLDDQVTQFPADRREKVKADAQATLAELEKGLATEKDPLVRQDLQIMITASKQSL